MLLETLRKANVRSVVQTGQRPRGLMERQVDVYVQVSLECDITQREYDDPIICCGASVDMSGVSRDRIHDTLSLAWSHLFRPN